MKTCVTILAAGLFLTIPALADDVDDATAAVEAYFSSLNAGNVDTWIELFAEGHTTFESVGTLLERTDSLEEQRKSPTSRGGFRPGTKPGRPTH